MNINDFLKVKKVRCVNNGGLSHLTEGKEYEIKSIDYISVSDNDGDKTCVDTDWFEPITNLSKSQDDTDTSADSVDNYQASLVDNADNYQASLVDNADNSQAFHVSKLRFKVGDPVYCPLQTKELCKVFSNDQEFQPQCPLTITKVRSRHSGVSGAVVACVDDYGYSDEYDNAPFIFHATPENHALLCKLYPHIEFEAPPKPLTGSDLARAMFDAGHEYVVGKVGNHVGVYYTWSEGAGHFFEACGTGAFDIEPIDPKTDEPLTQAVLDE